MVPLALHVNSDVRVFFYRRDPRKKSLQCKNVEEKYGGQNSKMVVRNQDDHGMSFTILFFNPLTEFLFKFLFSRSFYKKKVVIKIQDGAVKQYEDNFDILIHNTVFMETHRDQNVMSLTKVTTIS